MELAVGSRIGRFDVLAPLGAGGMGEVYRARDTKLGRDVALKILPDALARDPSRRSRFAREARLLAALNHPHIAAIHDLTEERGVLFLVMELVEGETLSRRLEWGRISVRQALEIGRRIALGLEAAHATGIIHRDLKPSNVKLTPEGGVKLLDFGLAKALSIDGRKSTETDLSDGATAPGGILGTAPYMSPEQARGDALDRRTDIWSLGCILFEMLAGARAFPGAGPVAVAAAREGEPQWSLLPAEVPLRARQLLERCLRKDPAQRLHDVTDARIEIEEALADATGAPRGTSASGATPGDRGRRRRAAMIAAAVIMAACGVGLFLLGRNVAERPLPSFRQLTFRRGFVTRARFGRDGQTVAYSARWDGGGSEVLLTRLDLPEARAFPLAPNARLGGIRGGELLVVHDDYTPGFYWAGRLARMPMVGGALRDVADDVVDSDWGPTGEIALVRQTSFADWGTVHQRLEYPLGQVLQQTSGLERFRDVRISPDGDRVALVVGHWGAFDGDLVVVDRSGRRSVLSSGWMEIRGVAWSPDAREVWFTAGGPGRRLAPSFSVPKSLHAVSISGRERLVLRTAGDLLLLDVLKDGRALVAHGLTTSEVRGKLRGDEKERDLTYLRGTSVAGIADDGGAILLGESGEAGGPHNAAYLLRQPDPEPIRLGEGAAVGLSPDGRRAVVLFPAVGDPRPLVISAGSDPPLELRRGSIDGYGGGPVRWLPDGQRVMFDGREKGRGFRTYVQQLPYGDPRPISPEGTLCTQPAARWAACFRGLDEKGKNARLWELRGVDEALVRPAPWIGSEECVLAWSNDERHAFVTSTFVPPFRVFRVEPATGRREVWLEAGPPDPAGVRPVTAFEQAAFAPDGLHYAYTYFRTLSDLYLVEGLR